MDKRTKDTLVRSPRENGGGWDAQKDLHSGTGRDEKKGKTQERMERGSRKRSSSAGSEKVERVGGRWEIMEGFCSTGQSPQWAVVPMEEEEDTGIGTVLNRRSRVLRMEESANLTVWCERKGEHWYMLKYVCVLQAVTCQHVCVLPRKRHQL